MAEAVGVAIGVLGLLSLYDTCIELAEQIELARNIGTDYQEAFTKVLSLRARLQTCGASWNKILKDNANRYSELEANFRPELDLTQKSLVEIKRLFENADTFHGLYGQDAPGGRVEEFSLIQTSAATFQSTGTAMNQLPVQMHRTRSLRRRIIWAVRDKKVFDKNIKNLAFFIEQLEIQVKRVSSASKALFQPVGQTQLASKCTLPINPTTSSLDMLSGTSSQPMRLEQDSNQSGHYFRDNIAQESARILQGNWESGNTSVKGMKHTYIGNYAGGNARIIQGNMIGYNMKEFWAD
jgi:hypothetical protein